jgi:hypothetical protein
MDVAIKKERMWARDPTSWGCLESQGPTHFGNIAPNCPEPGGLRWWILAGSGTLPPRLDEQWKNILNSPGQKKKVNSKCRCRAMNSIEHHVINSVKQCQAPLIYFWSRDTYTYMPSVHYSRPTGQSLWPHLPTWILILHSFFFCELHNASTQNNEVLQQEPNKKHRII